MYVYSVNPIARSHNQGFTQRELSLLFLLLMQLTPLRPDLNDLPFLPDGNDVDKTKQEQGNSIYVLALLQLLEEGKNSVRHLSVPY